MEMILDDIWTKNRDLHDLTLGGRLSRRLLGEVSVAVVTGSRPYVLKAGDLVARKPAASMTGMSILRANGLFRSVWVEDATFLLTDLSGSVEGGLEELAEVRPRRARRSSTLRWRRWRSAVRRLLSAVRWWRSPTRRLLSLARRVLSEERRELSVRRVPFWDSRRLTCPSKAWRR